MAKPKLLVVDDQIGVVSFLYDFFNSKGYEVFQATNAKEALKVTMESKPNIILLDINLGWRGGHGMDVLREVKKTSPRIRVLMMTSVDDDATIKMALDLGADDYIIKPFSLSYLEKVVQLKILELNIKSLGES